jgi:Cys-rich protein (TIGR01571 family)
LLCFFDVVQPEGGVGKGQWFLTPLPETYQSPRIQAPTGQWKDGLFDCFEKIPSDVEGSTPISYCCHPSTWCALCCGPLALAQVMVRMQLTWLGEPGPPQTTRLTWPIVVTLFVTCQILSWYINDYGSYDESSSNAQEVFMLSSIHMLTYVYCVWLVYARCRTRATLRARYQIPEEQTWPHGCEDCCYAYWFSPCITAQMLRHTGEYEHYPGVCCSSTGHPVGTPLVV